VEAADTRRLAVDKQVRPTQSTKRRDEWSTLAHDQIHIHVVPEELGRRFAGMAAVILAVQVATPCRAQQLTTAEHDQIDRDVLAVLAATGAPSASIAIVRGAQVVYERAYGDGRIDARTPATPSMRYAIGSVSKQFTATALLLLEEEGKLSLNDKVAEWFPQLTRARMRSDRESTGAGSRLCNNSHASNPGVPRRLSNRTVR
jgi:hypothetical protein